jgi:hypothetical protein
MNFLTSVVDGTPLVRARWALADVLPHCVCANCGEAQLQPTDERQQQEVEVMVSPSIKDRIAAMDMQAKYGLGTSNEERVTDNRDLPTLDERRERLLKLVKHA